MEPPLRVMVDARTRVGRSAFAFSEIIFPYRQRARAFVEVPRHKNQEADAAEDPERIRTKKLRIVRGNDWRANTTNDEA